MVLFPEDSVVGVGKMVWKGQKQARGSLRSLYLVPWCKMKSTGWRDQQAARRSAAGDSALTQVPGDEGATGIGSVHVAPGREGALSELGGQGPRSECPGRWGQ